jgi:quercetin dioxygenase-like cupin family protein
MQVRKSARPLFVAAIFGAGVATGLFAQPNMATDSPQRVEQKRTDLTGAPGMEVIASTAEYKPGDMINLHIHHGIETLYVIQGGMIQVPGKDPVPLPTGATAQFLRDAKHAGFKIVGDSPVKLFTVHVVDKGKPLYDYVK